LAFLASVLDLVAARTAEARPMKRGDRRDGDVRDEDVGGVVMVKEETEEANRAREVAANVIFMFDYYKLSYWSTGVEY